MVIVTGSLTAKDDAFDRLRDEALAHVHRSRTEAGCLSHAVFVDCENPLRLFFYEEWESDEALRMHFAQSGSSAFIAVARMLASVMTGPTIIRTASRA